MEHAVIEPTQNEIIFNLVIQLGQIILFFGLFIKFFWAKVSAMLDERRAKEEKFRLADEEYARLVAEANTKAEVIVAQAMTHKQHLLNQAQQAADAQGASILSETATKAQRMLEDAKNQAKTLHDDLYSGFQSAVSSLTKTVVQKIMSTDKTLWDEYVAGLVKELA